MSYSNYSKYYGDYRANCCNNRKYNEIVEWSNKLRYTSQMSLQSEGTMTSEDDCLEDVVLELMKEKGLLSQVKGQIAKFIQDNGRVNSKRFINPERADERVLSYIYEYLQWIGMKQTCSVLLSESPVKVDHTLVKKPDSNYRPKLSSLLEEVPPELDAKFLSFRKSEQERNSNSTTASSQPHKKRLDELIDTPKNLENNMFHTSTPKIASVGASDATYIKEMSNMTDSNLLMGFNTPISSEGFRGQSGLTKKPFIPERLFKDDPFQQVGSSNHNDENETTTAANLSISVVDPEALLTRDGEMPYKLSKSVEQFQQDEEEIRALEDQQEDMKKTEEEVMESSLSTDWSEEELIPSSKDKDPENPGNLEQDKVADGLTVENVTENENENSGVDRSKIYEVSDDFEEDQESEPHKSESVVAEDEEKVIEDKSKSVMESELKLETNNNNDDEELSNKSKSSRVKDKMDKVLTSEGIENKSNKANSLVEIKSPRKKSETEELSTSDMLSMDIDDEDTLDVSIPSDDKGMSSCEHVVSIK